MKRFLFFILLGLFAACKQQEVPTYKAEGGISFYVTTSEADSLNYSFALSPTPKERDTVFLKMRILGPLSDKARTFTVKAAVGTTARQGIDYELPNYAVPAGAINIRYPVIVFKTPEMSAKAFRLVLEVGDDKDLKPGAIGIEMGNGITNTKSLSQMKINISNRITKPSYWDQERYFGDFSEVKFKFMISVTGLTDFSEAAIGVDGGYNLPVKLQNALLAYEAIHGWLIDETGNRVTF